MIPRLTQNIGLKVTCVLLAILLWIALVGEEELSTSITAPIEYRNLPKDLEISSDVINSLHLEVRGPQRRLTSSNLSDAAAVLDLSSVNKPGERTFTIDGSNLHLPVGVALHRAIPAQLRLRFDETIARDVLVQIRYAGAPMVGYRVARQDSYPDVLQVIGPKGRVQQVQYAETDPIDLNGVTGEAEFKVHTFVNDPQVRVNGSSLVRVRVSVEPIESK
jgi:YbbR domain-containing protein